MTVRQVVGGWGKTSIVPHDNAQKAENKRRFGLIEDLRDFVRAKGGDSALVVTYLAIEKHFAGLPNIETGHFNAIAGLDSFNAVRSVFVIGRPLPDPRELRLLTIALTGRPIAEQEAQRETRGALMADGTGAAISVRAYTDPDLEAVRTAISDAEVIQAIGRGRAINRTPGSPLNVWVMADICLPIPVNELVRWADVRLNPVQRMAARGAVFLSPADAAKACPDVFPTADAARMAINRALGADPDLANIPLRIIIPREMFGKSPRIVTYRPAGRGQQTRRVIVLDWRLDGFRDWLETLLGSLALYEVAEPPPPPPPNPSAPAPTPPPVVPPDDGDPPDYEHDDPDWIAEPWNQANPQEQDRSWWRRGMTNFAHAADDG